MKEIKIVSRHWTYTDQARPSVKDAEKEIKNLVNKGYELIGSSVGRGHAMWTLMKK